MSTRILRLHHILTLRKQKEAEAYQQFSQALLQEQKIRKQHEQMLGYRSDYNQQVVELGSDGVKLSRLKNRINFIAQIDDVLNQLSKQLGQQIKIKKEREQDYIKARAASEAIVRLMAKLERQQMALESKREQKQSDAHALYASSMLTQHREDEG